MEIAKSGLEMVKYKGLYYFFSALSLVAFVAMVSVLLKGGACTGAGVSCFSSFLGSLVITCAIFFPGIMSLILNYIYLNQLRNEVRGRSLLMELVGIFGFFYSVILSLDLLFGDSL